LRVGIGAKGVEAVGVVGNGIAQFGQAKWKGILVVAVAFGLEDGEQVFEGGVEMVFNVGHGGKIRSSSELLKEHHQKQANI